MKQTKKAKPDVQNWYRDRYQHVVVQRKMLAFITLAALLCTLASVFIIAWMIPLKSIEPYVIQVDQKTGITQTVNPLTAKELTVNEAVNNYFIVQYIRAREGYNATELMHNYNLVRLLSEDRKVYREFMTVADPNNKDSNIARLGTAGTRVIKVKSITYLQPQVAQVRLMITEKGDRIPTTDLHRIVTIAFEYVKMNLSTEDRYLNPLGFRVTDYMINEDISQ